MEEIKKLESDSEDMKQELRNKAKRGCRLCYGRGYIGFYEKTNQVQFCRCVFRKRNERKSEERPEKGQL